MTSHKIDHPTYTVQWSEEDREYVAICSAYPSLSYLSRSPDKAFRGIRSLVRRTQLEEAFEEHLRIWKHETVRVTSMIEMTLHPSYQAIIGLGPRVIPLILEELRVNYSGLNWHGALMTLTGVNPVKGKDAGRVSEVTMAWIVWGQQNGFIPFNWKRSRPRKT